MDFAVHRDSPLDSTLLGASRERPYHDLPEILRGTRSDQLGGPAERCNPRQTHAQHTIETAALQDPEGLQRPADPLPPPQIPRAEQNPGKEAADSAATAAHSTELRKWEIASGGDDIWLRFAVGREAYTSWDRPRRTLRDISKIFGRKTWWDTPRVFPKVSPEETGNVDGLGTTWGIQAGAPAGRVAGGDQRARNKDEDSPRLAGHHASSESAATRYIPAALVHTMPRIPGDRPPRLHVQQSGRGYYGRGSVVRNWLEECQTAAIWTQGDDLVDRIFREPDDNEQEGEEGDHQDELWGGTSFAHLCEGWVPRRPWEDLQERARVAYAQRGQLGDSLEDFTRTIRKVWFGARKCRSGNGNETSSPRTNGDRRAATHQHRAGNGDAESRVSGVSIAMGGTLKGHRARPTGSASGTQSKSGSGGWQVAGTRGDMEGGYHSAGMERGGHMCTSDWPCASARAGAAGGKSGRGRRGGEGDHDLHKEGLNTFRDGLAPSVADRCGFAMARLE
ncbi:hypothetical protein BJ742DRAFT_779600 [Cladochytrium replicatum]|nr:hypothetical protein BJ742DRAFT_779600 [Cladochytrium replicatum]